MSFRSVNAPSPLQNDSVTAIDQKELSNFQPKEEGLREVEPPGVLVLHPTPPQRSAELIADPIPPTRVVPRHIPEVLADHAAGAAFQAAVGYQIDLAVLF